jgi:uncharacterized cupin superfamily protein
VPEAPLQESPTGLVPAGDGWFVVNVRDTWWGTNGSFGHSAMFEHWESGFPQLGVRITVLEPGVPSTLYHAENQQEAFLVLAGECRLIADGEERTLRAWDFFHCPAETEHVLVGAGDAPCAILMCGARTDDERLRYPVSEAAARYGASVAEETTDADEAYAAYGEPRLERPPRWSDLPWS